MSTLAAQATETLRIVYLSRAGDAAYLEQKAYTGLSLRQNKPPVEGARAAIRESRAIGRAANISFELVEVIVNADHDIVGAIAEQRLSGADVFLLDVPLEDMVAASEALANDPQAVLFNVRHGADVLRGTLCSPPLFHTISSDAMRSDALAQFLSAKNWRKVLVLTSDASVDLASAKSFMFAARKFRIDIVGERRFVLSNDPREREQNNVRLLTGDADYDAVFIADAQGEFARYLPYATALPRPIIGSEGLVASTWHWTFERNGAPQLNQRIRKLSGRDVTSQDWAAWAAVRSVVQAAVSSANKQGASLRRAMLAAEFSLDLYKIGAGSYRLWDHQLRQPVLLHTYNAVIAVAPIEGFLHQFHVFDSLGTDEAESPCRLPKP